MSWWTSNHHRGGHSNIPEVKWYTWGCEKSRNNSYALVNPLKVLGSSSELQETDSFSSLKGVVYKWYRTSVVYPLVHVNKTLWKITMSITNFTIFHETTHLFNSVHHHFYWENHHVSSENHHVPWENSSLMSGITSQHFHVTAVGQPRDIHFTSEISWSGPLPGFPSWRLERCRLFRVEMANVGWIYIYIWLILLNSYWLILLNVEMWWNMNVGNNDT